MGDIGPCGDCVNDTLAQVRSTAGRPSDVRLRRIRVLSAKASSRSIATNDLKVVCLQRRAGVPKCKPSFPHPIALGVGDNIEMIATFVNTRLASIIAGSRKWPSDVQFGRVRPQRTTSPVRDGQHPLNGCSGRAADWKVLRSALCHWKEVAPGSQPYDQTAGDNTNQNLLTSNASASTSYTISRYHACQ